MHRTLHVLNRNARVHKQNLLQDTVRHASIAHADPYVNIRSPIHLSMAQMASASPGEVKTKLRAAAVGSPAPNIFPADSDEEAADMHPRVHSSDSE